MSGTTATDNAQQATPAVPPASSQASTAPIRTSGILAGLLMATGIGWNAGLEARPFHPVVDGITALAVHVVPLVVVIACLVQYLRAGSTGAARGRGLTVASTLAIGFGIFSAIFSVTHPHAVMGIHNVNDILPIAILDAGAVLWLVRGRPARASGAPRKACGTGQHSPARAAA
jgi:hypothetical protein